MITIVFKLIPFVIGVDEAGAQYITDTLAIGAGIGVTLAIIRKGRILFWTAIGLLLIVKRGLSFKDLARIQGKLTVFCTVRRSVGRKRVFNIAPALQPGV